MQPNNQHLPLIRRIAAKEVSLFFASPIAYLFLATFTAITLFIFFWGEAFFSRNIADVRPLFEWMPILLIFLCSALTMRLWSEERRSGTLEHVLTQPAPLWYFVTGKFAGCLVLLAIALVMTLPLPITVSFIGELDWGPVLAGYLATFLLGAAYLSIGLFVSARSDNQIVSLISAVALCGIFYLIGTTTITDLLGNKAGEWLRLLGTGSRFDAITRGVIDLRDLYYYLSIIAVFLTLNTFVLEKERWATTRSTPHHKTWRTVTVLLVANALAANLWLGQINALRVDATRDNQYSISDATIGYMGQLQEPLLIRGYFSSKTHPLLAPLIPQLKDLMEEYDIAGGSRVRVEFIDPAANPELEAEANQKYGIHPVPFRVADRYQSSIVSSYFNVMVQYGDEYQMLGFYDLIEIKARTESNIDVQLRNPEHDLTQAIKKVLNNYQAGGNLFDTVKGEIIFNAYISAESALPEQLAEYKKSVSSVVSELQKNSQGRLSTNFIDPEANGGIVAQQIAQNYGFKPLATSLLSNDRFYFYLTLTNGDRIVQIPLDDMSESSFKRNLEAAVKRFAGGFTKTVALVTPTANPAPEQYNTPPSEFGQLEQFLGTELNVVQEDLSDGAVSGEADILLLAAPGELTDKQLFAIDQFLMQGGTIIAATSPYTTRLSNRPLDMQQLNSPLHDWLAHHGLTVENSLVLDSQNASFPIPVTRSMGGFQFQDIRMLDYPYFIDIRGDGLNQENPVTTDLPQITLAWASPITLNQDKQAGRTVTELFRSSGNSWLSSSTDIMPRASESGLSAFTPEGEKASHLLGVITAGQFTSYFAEKGSPLLTAAKTANVEADPDNLAQETDKPEEEPGTIAISSVIGHSPESARIILFSSNDFLRDSVISMAGASTGSQYLNTLQLLTNTVDWSLEDSGLLGIRARGHFNRTLPPMDHNIQLLLEYLNYGLGIIALTVIALVHRQRKQSRQRNYLAQLAN